MSNKVPVLVSARHTHVSKEDFAVLFGEGKELTVKAPLGQPGQFASDQIVTIVGTKGELSLRILGPFRNETQVEVSATEARGLGIAPPIRESGQLENSPGILMKGPVGEIQLSKGIIIAKRHIHATNDDAKRLNISDQETVMVKTGTEERNIIFDDVVVRVSDSYALEMHIDTDEGNAASVSSNVFGEIIKHK